MIHSLFHRPHSFIEVYDDALSEKDCDTLIKHFEKSPHLEGRTSQGYYPDVKKCAQITIDLEDLNSISNMVKLKSSECMSHYAKKYHNSLGHIYYWSFYRYANIQKYDGEDEGYKIWHCEHDRGEIESKRVIAWMIYLNDAKSGTEFSNYPTINAKRGRCVIWPSSWTHTHKGVTPNKGLKYIVIGWCSYIDSDTQ